MIKYEITKILKEHENIIRRTSRYSNEISFKREETKPWDSKLGGCPYLKSIEEYPVYKDGKPMLFLAQINLTDLEKLDDLPEKGLLQFFIENDDMFGLESPIVVKYIEDYEENEEHLIKKNPYENDEDFLLLQLDIDDECGIMFGDSGNCVFSIPKDALKNKDFSKVVYDWQCC